MIFISYKYFFFFFWVPPTPYPYLFFLLTHLKKQYWFLKLIDLSLNAFILKYEISIIYLSCSSWLPIFAFPIFWLFFLSSKVSKMKFNQKSLIYKNTTLYDIDFYQKLEFCDFFKESFYWLFFEFFIKNTPKFHKILKKPTFWYTSIYYIFLIRILRSFQQSNH